MDDGGEALVGFVGAPGDALELLEFAEEILDEVTPLVELGVEPRGRGSSWMLGDDYLGAALVQIGDDGVAVESLVGDQPAEGEALDEGRGRLPYQSDGRAAERSAPDCRAHR